MSDACVVEVTDERFENEVLRHPGTVLVDFYTKHCGPCKLVAPAVEQLCSERRTNLKVLKIDAAENPSAAAAYGISAVPTFVLFQDGRRVGQFSGVQSKSQFEKWISQSTSGAA